MSDSVDPERLVISWAIRNKNLLTLVQLGLSPDDFADDPDRADPHSNASIYDWMLAHYRDKGEAPGLDALRLHDPNYHLGDPTDTPDTYVEDIKRRNQHNTLIDMTQGVAVLLEKDQPDEALALAQAKMSELTAESTSALDEDITFGTAERYAEYDALRANPGQLRGMPTGFDTIDRATAGIQPGQFIVFIGAQKAGKSSVVMMMAQHMHRRGKRGLLISFEMSAAEQKARWDGFWSRVNYMKYLTGNADRQDMLKLAKAHRQMENGWPFILSTDIGRTITVSGVAAKIEQHQPDFVVVDGMYLMMDDYGEMPGSPQALRNISRDFKRLCQRTQVPIIGTTQASEAKMTRRGGITTGSLYGTAAFGQDCDVLIGLQKEDQEEEIPAQLRVLESRHGPRVRSDLLWDWDTMTVEELIGREDDVADDEPASPLGGY